MTVTEPVRRRRNRGSATPTTTSTTPGDEPTPVAGILTVQHGRGSIRTRGYLPEPDEVRVPGAHLTRYDLRPGDEVTGMAAAPAGQRNRTLVRLDTVNGLAPDEIRGRPQFAELSATHPQERLRLETDPDVLTTRVIDLVMPLGKGQRALIVSPPKAGKTTVLRDIANAVSRNHPECHILVLLVDERPEEVTDMRRSITGEVVASPSDRSPADHIAVADLAIERGKRLVELGRDVVIVLDSITRLGRSHNNASAPGGRTMTGGIDSAALQAPKRLLGAARNTEAAGSLTIIASALVDTGSAGDNLLFEEYKGTGNAELRLDRRIAERRVFPAIDISASGTRKEELLLTPRELAATHALRRALSQLPPTQALEQLLTHLRRTRTNAEFLSRLAGNGRG
jgi:transcription termination factor Rho